MPQTFNFDQCVFFYPKFWKMGHSCLIWEKDFRHFWKGHFRSIDSENRNTLFKEAFQNDKCFRTGQLTGLSGILNPPWNLKRPHTYQLITHQSYCKTEYHILNVHSWYKQIECYEILSYNVTTTFTNIHKDRTMAHIFFLLMLMVMKKFLRTNIKLLILKLSIYVRTYTLLSMTLLEWVVYWSKLLLDWFPHYCLSMKPQPQPQPLHTST